MSLSMVTQQRFAPEWDSTERSENDPDIHNNQDTDRERDPEIGAAFGILGGSLVGAVAGGPAGAVIGAIAGGVASGLGVGAVDHFDREAEKTKAHYDGRAATFVYRDAPEVTRSVDPPPPARDISASRQRSILSGDALAAATIFALEGFDDARSVVVAGTFNNWSTRKDQLVRHFDHWVTMVNLDPGIYAYKYVVDGVWMLDPANNVTATDSRGCVNSVRMVGGTTE
ncbi:MAG: glycogen-binding domain-containing protein [Capsulimonadaceae bacterium]